MPRVQVRSSAWCVCWIPVLWMLAPERLCRPASGPRRRFLCGLSRSECSLWRPEGRSNRFRENCDSESQNVKIDWSKGHIFYFVSFLVLTYYNSAIDVKMIVVVIEGYSVLKKFLRHSLIEEKIQLFKVAAFPLSLILTAPLLVKVMCVPFVC